MSERLSYSFVWKVENFSYCLQKRNDSLESPSFRVEDLSDTEWRLLLYPRGTDDENKIALYLQRDDGGPLSITVDFELAFLDTDESVLKMALLKEHAFEKRDGYGIPEFVDRGIVCGLEKKDYLPEDTLTVRCQLWWKDDTRSVTENGSCLARTLIDVEKGTFKWPIRSFSNFPANKKTSLFVERNKKHEPPLSVELYLTGGYQNDRKVSIDIILCNLLRETFCICNASVLDAHGRSLDSSANEHWFKKDKDKQVWQLRPFLKRSYLLSKKNLYLPKDVLTLQFEFGLSSGVSHNDIEHSVRVSSPLSPKTDEASTQVNVQRKAIASIPHRNTIPLRDNAEYSHSFVHDLHCLYDERLLCDFAFRAGAETFPVHKCVLGARSPVFRAMFTNDMLEGDTGGDFGSPLDIPDLDAQTMHSLLTFIYTDSVQEVTCAGAFKLYFAADKYAIQSLKQMCVRILAGGLCLENLCEVLSLADMHQDEELKKFAQVFIAHNDAQVLSSDQWRGLEAEDVALAYETLREVYKLRLQI